MRTFRLIGMALLAVCVSFASCSDDDEPSKNDDGVITNQKLLVELRMTDEDGVSIMEYSYDSKGKLLSANYRESDVILLLGGQTKSLKAPQTRMQ